MGYQDGVKYAGTVAMVGDFDRVNGKVILRVIVEGPHGSLPAVVWLDPSDGKTVNGNKLPSSLERAHALSEYLCGHKLSRDTARRWFQPRVNDRKPVEFMAVSRTTDAGNTVWDARYIEAPRGLTARNAPDAAQLDLLLGGTDPRQTTLPVTAAPAKAPHDDEIPF